MTTTKPAFESAFGNGLGDYIKSIGGHDRVTVDEEVSLARAWRDEGCVASRERLITANLRLVIAIARRYSGRGVPQDELVAEGNLGLIQAVDNYDPSGGARFSTYAVYWIRHSIAEVFARASAKARLSRNERLDAAAIEQAGNAFLAEHGRQASATDLSVTLRWHPEKVRSTQSLVAGRVRVVAFAENAEDGSTLPSPSTAADDTDEQHGSGSDKAWLESALATMSEEDRRMVELRFGLDCGEPRPLNVVATIMELPLRVVKKRVQIALTKLSRAAWSKQHRLLDMRGHHRQAGSRTDHALVAVA